MILVSFFPAFLLFSSCFASMAAGGRRHGEKSGIYHFSSLS